MDPLVIRVGLLALLAAISGFFALGFAIYSIIAASTWYIKKKHPERLWGGLFGLVLNSLIFVLTFPRVYPLIQQALSRVLSRFF